MLTRDVEEHEGEWDDGPVLPVVVSGDESDEDGCNDQEDEDLVSGFLIYHTFLIYYLFILSN